MWHTCGGLFRLCEVGVVKECGILVGDRSGCVECVCEGVEHTLGR